MVWLKKKVKKNEKKRHKKKKQKKHKKKNIFFFLKCVDSVAVADSKIKEGPWSHRISNPDIWKFSMNSV
jgi:hypothetical protein